MNIKNNNGKASDFKGCIFNTEEMKRNGHITLIGHDNNTVTYLNDDGTRTIYISSAPIEEKELHIKEKNDSYVSEGNNINVKLPKIINQEIGINVGGFMNIYPPLDTEHTSEFLNLKNIFGQVKECVEYKDFYDNKSLYCYTTSFGMNCEIVIPEYTGENIFSMKIKQPDGFFIEEETDYMSFRDEEDLKSMIYTSLAVDSNGVWNYNNKIDLMTEDNGVAYVNFILDEEFLKDSRTKYPVVINQSFNAYKHKQPDTSVYSETGNTTRHYLSPYMLLGDKTVKGEGWALLRYEVLNDIDIAAENVLSAKYCFSNLFEAKENVTVGAYAITSDWCSVNTRWKSRPDYDELPVQTTKVRNAGFHGIDITELFVEIIRSKGEYEPPYSVRNSFFIKSDTKDSNLLLASGDSGLASPYLKVVLKG